MPTHELHSTLLKVAKKDLDLAKLGTSVEDPYIEGVCFHCQQYAEKALKSFLKFNDVKYRFIHDLESLCEDCEKLDSTFTEIDILCQVLTQYSPDKRYLDDGLISKNEMFEAIELAEKVLNFVKERVVPKV